MTTKKKRQREEFVARCHHNVVQESSEVKKGFPGSESFQAVWEKPGKGDA